jgi:peptidoglycan/xylan/chitin deacetylase (PgdA/CDA1 family)
MRILKNWKLMLVISITTVLFIVSALFVYLYIFQEEKVAILTYHDIVDNIPEDQLGDTVNITTTKFEKQIKWLADNNYTTISFEDLYNWKVNGKALPRKSVVLAFDDGWISFYTKAMPILEKYNMKGAVFVVLKNSANVTPDDAFCVNLEQIQDIIKNHPNIEVLSHSYNLHIRENANSNDYNVYTNDICEVKKYIVNPEYYAYPFGIHNDEYIQALKDNGYKLAFTFGPYDFVKKTDDNYKVPRLGIFETMPDWKFKLKMFLEM